MCADVGDGPALAEPYGLTNAAARLLTAFGRGVLIASRQNALNLAYGPRAGAWLHLPGTGRESLLRKPYMRRVASDELVDCYRCDARLLWLKEIAL